MRRTAFGQLVQTSACPTCGGDGKTAEQPCEQCDGAGREVRRRTWDVDVPAGIESGQRIRIAGAGHAGEPGGRPGDLYILVNVAEDERFERRGEDLSRALGAAAQGRVTTGFRVYALGPLRVERDGVPLSRWGGEKAGSRQAEAIFAFLFDRGERGVAKDEILELIWPDVDLERADLAFHRTLGGLRTVLEPSRRARDRGDAITFHHDRYRLDPGLVAGSDVADLEAELLAASQATDVTDRVTHLERARALYRGDYLDDCPFYGDSSAVEDQRELLRGRWIDVLLSLGEVYEAGGDRPAAAAAFRQARQAAGEPLPSADAALSRLGSPI